MIIKYNFFNTNISTYIKNNFFLFYGPNIGKVENSCEKLISCIKQSNEKISNINSSSSDFSNQNFSDFINKYNSPDIFGNSYIILFSLNDSKINKEILNLLKNYNLKFLKIIFKTGPMEKKSALRNYFEKSKEVITVPCYEETIDEKRTIIKDCFTKERIKIGFKTLEKLTNILSNERSEIINEIEKIIILIKSDNTKSIGKLSNIISDSIYFDQTKFIYNLVSGKSEDLINSYLKFTDFKKNELQLVNFLIEHFFKILFVKNKIKSGKPIALCIKELRPPIFFKFEKEFEQQVKKWDFYQILRVLRKLFSTQSLFLDGKISSSSNLLFSTLLILKNSKQN